jgi:C-terminal processing protease CtpA/Prc
MGRVGRPAGAGGDHAWVGTIEANPDVGYFALFRMVSERQAAADVDSAWRHALGHRALIVDLRANNGGDETLGLSLASFLADEPRVYAKRRVRSGPGHADFGPFVEARLRTRPDGRFAGPIVVLLGPGCVSSGEGFAKMLDVLPNVRTVGLPTRGASGNPQPVDLPSGITVRLPRWQDALPDGTLTEGRGVVPDVSVGPKGEGDPTFDAGIAEAKRLLEAGKPPK